MILASDTFIHPNQSGWPTSSGGQTWSAPRGAGSYSITSNEGVNSANGGTFSVARIGTGISASQEIDVRLKPADTTSDIGAVGRFVDANNFYYGVLSGGKALIGKDVSGTFTTIASVAFSYSTANFYQLKFNLVGTTLKLKAWQDGTTEPASWTVTATDSSIASGGYGLGSDAAGSTSFDSLTVTDAAAALTTTTWATTESAEASAGWQFVGVAARQSATAVSVARLRAQSAVMRAASAPGDAGLQMRVQAAWSETLAPVAQAAMQVAATSRISAPAASSFQVQAQAAWNEEAAAASDTWKLRALGVLAARAQLAAHTQLVVMSIVTAEESASASAALRVRTVAGWQDFLSPTSDLTWLQVTPAATPAAAITITWVTRDDAITFVGRDDTITFVGRDDTITWKGRD